jgi:hypothetical protein
VSELDDFLMLGPERPDEEGGGCATLFLVFLLLWLLAKC